LEQNIALGLLSSEIADDQQGLEVDIGEDRRRAKVSVLPFC
jgi:glycine cleavage system aminomethyltransferase T